MQYTFTDLKKNHAIQKSRNTQKISRYEARTLLSLPTLFSLPCLQIPEQERTRSPLRIKGEPELTAPKN